MTATCWAALAHQAPTLTLPRLRGREWEGAERSEAGEGRTRKRIGCADAAKLSEHHDTKLSRNKMMSRQISDGEQ